MSAFRYLKNAIEFIEYGNLVNPSRMDVEHFVCVQLDAKNRYLARYRDERRVIVSCVIPAVVTESNVLTQVKKTSSNNSTAFSIKRVYAMAFRQEYELMVGKFGMIFGFDSIAGDYRAPETGFVTRPAWAPRFGQRGSNVRKPKGWCLGRARSDLMQS